MPNKRIDDFIAVAAQRYDANPKVWTHVYEQLRKLLDFDDAKELDAKWHSIKHKKDLEAWDELFLENTIDESKLAKRYTLEEVAKLQREQYEFQALQQRAALHNAYQYTTSTSTAGGLHPVQTDSSVTTTLWDRMLGRN